jgi:hypothetical protein
VGDRIDAHHAAETKRGLMPTPVEIYRQGCALISTATPCLAQARTTFSTSIS